MNVSATIDETECVSPLDGAFTFDEVRKAFEDCIRTKRNSLNAIEYTVDLTDKLTELWYEINDGSYEIGTSITFVVKIPVYREVFAADFRDRVVHHLVMNELMPLFDAEFIDNSFSCRVGKGVMNGVSTMEKELKKCSENYTKQVWALKMDVKSFFMSIDKARLAKRVDLMIKERYPENRKKEKLRWLCEKIIMHHPEKNCKRKGDMEAWDFLPPHKSLFNVGDRFGLPIGNLTSQIFANFYMNPLDRFVTEELGSKHYGRYVDDFLIFSTDKEKLRGAIRAIKWFVKEEIGVTVHPDKIFFQDASRGTKFIGGVLKYGRKYILDRTKGNLYYKLTHEFRHPSKAKVERLCMVVNSYLGFMRFYDSYRIRKEMFTKDRLLDEWVKTGLITVDKDFKKIMHPKKKTKVRKMGVFEFCNGSITDDSEKHLNEDVANTRIGKGKHKKRRYKKVV